LFRTPLDFRPNQETNGPREVGPGSAVGVGVFLGKLLESVAGVLRKTENGVHVAFCDWHG